MSNDALSWAWRAPLESGPKFVLVALADHGSDHSGEDWTCFPSIKRLVERTGMSEKTVRRHLDSLEAEGWISRVRRRNGNRLGIYDYRLHRDRVAGVLPECGPEAVNLTGTAGGPEAVNLSASSGQSVPPVAVKLTGQEPSIEPSEEPTPGAREPGDEGFEAGFAAYPESGRRRSDVRQARAAWAKAADEIGAEELTRRVRRYAEGDADLKTGKHGARAFERWLAGEVWRHWGAPEVRLDAGRTACGVPAPTVQALAARAREPIAGCLAGAAWVAETRTIVCTSKISRDRLIARVGEGVLRDLELQVVGPGEHQLQRKAVGG